MGAVDAASRPRRGGRPTAEQAAQLDRAVHESALELFLAQGYDGTSMDAVAAAAGTTKATLYARFPSKEAMFLAVLGWASARPDWPVPDPQLEDLDDVHDVVGLTAVLQEMARSAAERARHPQVVELVRLGAVHYARFPELARHARVSPWPQLDVLARLLRRLRSEGVVHTDEDPDLLAEHFYAMVSGLPALLALSGVVRAERDQALRTESAVRLFVAALVSEKPAAD